MKPSLRPAFLMAIVAMCTIPPAADAQSQDLSGRWQATFIFDTSVSGVLELTHQGVTVTGRLNTGFTGGDMAVEGRYADRTLTCPARPSAVHTRVCSSILPPHSSRTTK